ncbi:restriction endonuclease [Herbaspirillum sp. DW155]|uniref:restriction endonuclease n=1 Tax=Herbaspirillum sp. DW155 TaxID=3095609 RepID=UPI00308EE740|nr:restriction endonuclease [Herbaspirillum sp. DW155]
MPEPTTSAATGYAVAVGTVTLTGSFLGLQYDLLLAGIFGGCVALSFTRQTPLLRMAIMLITSALAAAYGGPVAMAWAAQSSYFEWTAKIPEQMRLFSAFAIGVSTQTLGPYAIQWARAKFGGVNPQSGAPQ